MDRIWCRVRLAILIRDQACKATRYGIGTGLACLTMKNPNEHGSAEAAWEAQPLAYDYLSSTILLIKWTCSMKGFAASLQGDGKDNAKVTEAQGPEDQLPERNVEGSLFLGSQEIVHCGNLKKRVSYWPGPFPRTFGNRQRS